MVLHLTLTSVVFELQGNNNIYFDDINLTLTSVVFELVTIYFNDVIFYNLTLTSVVFELPKFVVPLWLYVI